MLVKNGKFNCLAGKDNHTVSYSYTYDENWFKAETDKAPYGLLHFSLCAAMSASREEFITDLFDQLGFKYTNNINYEKEGMNILAGDKITQSVYYPAQTIDGKLYYNSIGYAIGIKEIEEETILFVAVRGGDYGIEWGSNFNIGTGTDFEGFSIAADQVLAGIKNQIEINNLKGNLKVLVVGYSRGAATTNLIASRLNKGEITGLNKDNVFAFGFECPRTTTAKDALSEAYNNIYSVANPDDLVPKLAMAVWGYRRYGRTFFLPSYQIDKDFKVKQDVMLEVAKQIGTSNIKPAIDDDYNITQFVNDLAFVAENQEHFKETFQDGLEQIAAIFLGGAHEEPSPKNLEALNELETGIIAVNPPNAKYMESILGSDSRNILMINPYGPLLSNHNMELILTWISSFKNYSSFSKKNVRYIFINNVSNLIIKNCEDKVLGEMHNNQFIQSFKEIYTKIDDNDQFIAIVPENMEIKIEIESGENENISFMIQEFDMETGIPSKIIDYSNLALEQGENIDCFIPNLESGDTYSVLYEDKIIQPTAILNKDEVKYYRINSIHEGEGVILGGGYFTTGEYVQLRAVASGEQGFDGWYINDKKVSSELVYRFKVEETVTVIGKFK